MHRCHCGERWLHSDSPCASTIFRGPCRRRVQKLAKSPPKRASSSAWSTALLTSSTSPELDSGPSLSPLWSPSAPTSSSPPNSTNPLAGSVFSRVSTASWPHWSSVLQPGPVEPAPCAHQASIAIISWSLISDPCPCPFPPIRPLSSGPVFRWQHVWSSSFTSCVNPGRFCVPWAIPVVHRSELPRSAADTVTQPRWVADDLVGRSEGWVMIANCRLAAGELAGDEDGVPIVEAPDACTVPRPSLGGHCSRRLHWRQAPGDARNFKTSTGPGFRVPPTASCFVQRRQAPLHPLPVKAF